MTRSPRRGPYDARATVPRVSPAFSALAATLEQEGAVDAASSTTRRGFGSAALKVDGKIFAMPVEGALVVKLPAERVAALVQSGVGSRFDPGHGRLMREWVVVRDATADWLGLSREAREFVRSGAARRKRQSGGARAGSLSPDL